MGFLGQIRRLASCYCYLDQARHPSTLPEDAVVDADGGSEDLKTIAFGADDDVDCGYLYSRAICSFLAVDGPCPRRIHPNHGPWRLLDWVADLFSTLKFVEDG